MAKDSGLSRYNLTPYNLREGVTQQTLLFSRRVTANVHAVAGGRIHILFSRTLRAIFGHKVSASSGIPFRRHKQLVFFAEADFHLGILILRRPQMTFEQSIRFGKDMNISRTVSTEIGAAPHVGKWMHFGRRVNLPVLKELHVGKEMPFRRGNWVMFDAFVLMGLMLYARAVVNVTIPPGGEIRINSDAFTAMMGTKNILHLYEGDWIHFDRNTTRLIVHAGAGVPLAGDVLYNWRFV